MKEELYDDLFEEKEERTDFRLILFKYIIRWPWFVASVLLCLFSAWVYLRYATPVYDISATIIIKDDKKGGAGIGDLSAFQDMGILSSSKNIDNEIEMLRSKSLIKKVVIDLGIYVSYSAQGRISDAELYGNSPVLVHFSPEDAESLAAPLLLELTCLGSGEVELSTVINGVETTKNFKKLPAVLSTGIGTLTFLPNPEQLNDKEKVIYVAIQKPLNVAKAYLEDMIIEPTSKTTSVATISLKDTNRERGENFISKLVALYNQDGNDDKNEVAENTARFIDERISVINQELGTTERELESFKRESGLTDLSSDAQLAVTQRSGYDKLCVENGTQINLVQYLADYLDKPEYASTTIPANVGLNDVSLTALITQYNTLVLERNRLLRTSSESNPVVLRLDGDIRNLRLSLVNTVASVQKGLLITKADLDRQTTKYAGRISNAPSQERLFVGIQRQQEIKAGLYLMLLQKREENNITLAATANNAKIIDDALANDTPVFPKKSIIYLVVLVLGFAIPISIIYLIELLSFRIEGRADVEKLTKVPVIGDIPLTTVVEEGEVRPVVVFENTNDIMAETFRSLRTNLLFMLADPDKRVILVTSTTSGEGKTFVASNLAVSLSLLGHKVIILGLDIRKPGLNKVFKVSVKDPGITQYLSAPQTTDIHSLIRPSEVTANLDVLPGGIVPPNPTELVSRPALANLIDQLKREYEYIVLDTAPIGMVTDTQIIGRVADISIYVCRADYTSKNDYQLINDLYENKSLPQLCTVINGLDMKKKKYGYYYGYGKYGKYYGYGKKYGQGYGYGYDETSGKSK